MVLFVGGMTCLCVQTAVSNIIFFSLGKIRSGHFLVAQQKHLPSIKTNYLIASLPLTNHGKGRQSFPFGAILQSLLVLKGISVNVTLTYCSFAFFFLRRHFFWS